MSYDLFLNFDPPVKLVDFRNFFLARQNYNLSESEIHYQNEKTGVYFIIHMERRKHFLSGGRVSQAHFVINYFRPSFFGVEAEGEITALANAFCNHIDDPQLNGMGKGPYTPEGFLGGWNAGNAFTIGAILSKQEDLQPPCLPSAQLHESWDWNRTQPSRQARAGDNQFVPRILYITIGGRAHTAIAWSEGMPAILPKVDFVLVGRQAAEANGNSSYAFGRATWQEVTDLLTEAGCSRDAEGFDVNYAEVPAKIASFLATIPEVVGEEIAVLSA
ncbi:MAG: hypothetical protein ACRECY_11145, partial [Phyllobacterium sp.]